jgi:hypothetical protein
MNTGMNFSVATGPNFTAPVHVRCSFTSEKHEAGEGKALGHKVPALGHKVPTSPFLPPCSLFNHESLSVVHTRCSLVCTPA